MKNNQPQNGRQPSKEIYTLVGLQDGTNVYVPEKSVEELKSDFEDIGAKVLGLRVEVGPRWEGPVRSLSGEYKPAQFYERSDLEKLIKLQREARK